MNQTPNPVWAKEVADLQLPDLVLIAKSMIEARRALHGSIPLDLIHDPALDQLLQLFIVHAGVNEMTITELAVSTTVPPSNAGRWIAALQQHGLIWCKPDAVGLTDSGLARMTDMLRAVAASQRQFGQPA